MVHVSWRVLNSSPVIDPSAVTLHPGGELVQFGAVNSIIGIIVECVVAIDVNRFRFPDGACFVTGS